MALTGLDGVVQRANAVLCERVGADPAGRPLADLVDRRRPRRPPVPGRRAARSSCATATLTRWGLWHHSLLTGRDGSPEALDQPLHRRLQAQARRGGALLAGPPRRADRAAQPRALPRAPQRRASAPEPRPRRRAVRRPRRLQGRQRLARPRRRRPPADRRRRAAVPRPAPRRHRRPLRRRRVHRPAARHRRARPTRLQRGRAPGRRAARAAGARRRAPLRHRQRRHALGGPGEDDPQALLRDADAAMYRAKELGKSRYEVFDDSMRERAIERLELESGLRHALDAASCGSSTSRSSTLADGRVDRRRGAAALGPPDLRHRRAAALHPAGRAQRADRPDRRVGPARGLPPARRLGRRRAEHVGQRVGAPARLDRPRRRRARGPRGLRHRAGPPVPGDHRDGDDGRPGRDRRDARRR